MTRHCFCTWSVDSLTGEARTFWLNASKFEYDCRSRPWYQAAKPSLRNDSEMRTWSDVYVWQATVGSAIGIDCVVPLVSRSGEWLGVTDASLTLSLFSTYLEEFTADLTDCVLFIVESDGDLIAASVGSEYILRNDGEKDGELTQVAAINCTHPTVAKAAAFFSSFNFSDGQVFIHDHRFVQASTVTDSSGQLKWTLVVSQPTACAANHKEDIAHASCTKCEWPKTSAAGASQCDRCVRSWFENANGNCEECPKGALCETEGLGIKALQTEPGYWRGSVESSTIYECARPRACVGGNVSSQCERGYIGINCDTCESGWFHSWISNTCEKCGSTRLWLGSSVLAVLLGVALIGYSARFILRLMKSRKSMEWLVAFHKVAHVKVFILVVTLQVRSCDDDPLLNCVPDVNLSSLTGHHIVHNCERNEFDAIPAYRREFCRRSRSSCQF